MAHPRVDKPVPRPDRASLHDAALRHLSRYSSTQAGLLRVLDRRVSRWQRAGGGSAEEATAARAAAREVVAALVASGMIDDAGFAAARARRLVRGGRSRRAVSAHLAEKGVDLAVAGPALPHDEAELMAAIAFARRRRVGPFGAEADDPARPLALFARAGFPRGVAERVLRLSAEEAGALLAAYRQG